MHTYLVAAISLDGYIAQSPNGRSFDWTSPEDKQFYISMLKKSDAIVIGSKTFHTFSRYPKDSRWIIYTSQPEAFVNPKPAVIQAEGTNEKPADLIKRLEQEGCQSVMINGGASIYSQFLQAGLIDTLYLTVEPIIFGEGIKLFSDQVEASLQLKKVDRIGQNTLLLEYEVQR